METVLHWFSRLMSLLIVVCTALTALAQDYEYVPLVREGVKWEYLYNYDPFFWPEGSPLHIDFPYAEGEDFNWEDLYDLYDPFVRYTTEFCGDTIIGGLKFSKLHLNFLGYDFITDYMREEDGLVYSIRNKDCDFIDLSCEAEPRGVPTENYESLGEMLVFDFNDMTNVIGEDKVDHVEMVEIGGKLRKKTVWTLYEGSVDGSANHIVTIEGIGTDGQYFGRMPYNHYVNLKWNYTYHLLRTIGPDGGTEYSRYPELYSTIDRTRTDCQALTTSVSDGMLHVQLPAIAGAGRLEVLDLTGRVASTVATNGLSAVTLPALSAGIYVVRYSVAGHQFTQKVRL